MSEDINSTAHHEAGHAVIHHIHGTKVILVTLCDHNEDGLTQTEKRMDNDYVIGGFAGPWAQELFSEEPMTESTRREWSDDFQMIDDILRILPNDAADSPQMILREKLREESRRKVVEYEDSIRHVADHLLRYGDIGNPAHSYGESANQILMRLINASHK